VFIGSFVNRFLLFLEEKRWKKWYCFFLGHCWRFEREKGAYYLRCSRCGNRIELHAGGKRLLVCQ